MSLDATVYDMSDHKKNISVFKHSNFCLIINYFFEGFESIF